MSASDVHEPAKAFNGLRRADGTPDVRARREALDKIVGFLSHHEIRSLRTRFNAVNFSKDICLNLPVELLLHVSDYLDFEDLMAAQQVSRAWRNKFASPDFSIGIIKMHFRAQWEQTDLEDAAAKASLVDWFPKAAKKRIRKQRGQYISKSAYHYQRGGVLMPTHYKIEHQYDSGRVAYRFNESIIVQVLNEGPLSQPKAYLEASRIPLRPGKWILSNEFLIAQGLGRLNLLAWSLTSDDLHRVRLPSSTKYMSARSKHIGIITKSNEVLVWEVGGSLTSVGRPDLQESEGSHLSPEAIIFHPLHQRHFFIFYQNWPGVGILVQEFVSGTYQQTYRADFPSDLSNSLQKNTGFSFVRAFGDQGLCVIGWDVNLPGHKEPYWARTFNMYTHQFGRIYSHSLRGLPDSVKQSARTFQHGEGINVGFSLVYPDVVEHCAGCIHDDDFEIVFGDYGYVVWAYDDIKLPIAGSLSDESMQIAPAARPLPLNRRHKRMSTNG